MDFFSHYDGEDEFSSMNPCGEDVEIGIYQNLLDEARMQNPDTHSLLPDMQNKLRQGLITAEQRDYILAVLTHTTHIA